VELSEEKFFVRRERGRERGAAAGVGKNCSTLQQVL